MKTTIEVKDRREDALVKTAMDDPAVRALVLVMGALAELPTDAARRRVLQYATDKLAEEKGDKNHA